eukprot:12537512-Alexandrium_andersonii.AAC.1
MEARATARSLSARLSRRPSSARRSLASSGRTARWTLAAATSRIWATTGSATAGPSCCWGAAASGRTGG